MDNDYWIVNLNSIGAIEWIKSFGGIGNDRAYAIQQTTDGGYIAAGYSVSNDGDITNSNGATDCWVVKLTSTGNLQ